MQSQNLDIRHAQAGAFDRARATCVSVLGTYVPGKMYFSIHSGEGRGC